MSGQAISERCLGPLPGALLLSLIVGGCASQQVPRSPAPRDFTASSYADVYERWTRDADDFAFGRLSDVLHVTATFQGWEHRWAYVVRYAQDHSLGTETRANMLRASLEDAEERHRFFVTLAGPHYRESDLTREDAAWRVLLVDEAGRQTVPVEIEKVDADAAARAYFPSVSPFRHAFRLAYPVIRSDGTETIPSAARRAILRFTGPAGSVDLIWEFAPET